MLLASRYSVHQSAVSTLLLIATQFAYGPAHPLIVHAAAKGDAKNAAVKGDAKTAVVQPKVEEKRAKIVICVNVPFNANSRDDFVISPYPVAVSKLSPLNGLPTNQEELSQSIKNAIYVYWGKPEHVPIDWRFDRAFRKALRVSRKQIPRNTIGLDAWTNEFLPFARKEVELINASERSRRHRYDLLAALPDDYHSQLEETARQKGLSPISLRVRQVRPGIKEAQVTVPAATWWVAGKHMLAGITYYWQEEISLKEITRYLELNEGNALVVQGHI